jgi:hypothetical protein
MAMTMNFSEKEGSSWRKESNSYMMKKRKLLDGTSSTVRGRKLEVRE